MKKIIFIFQLFLIILLADSIDSAEKKKLILIGIDGMDPNLMRQYLDAGKMPNFQKIIDNKGDFKKLATTFPPQSPVAWATFSIGANPGQHGIFDFIHRDPETLFPFLSVTSTEGSEISYKLNKIEIPLSAPKITNLRQGIPFWDYLCENNIPSYIMQIPANYPPTYPKKNTHLKALSGMGTPDLLGTQGTFSFYTSEPTKLKQTIGGGKIYPVKVIDNKVENFIYGPEHPYKNHESYGNESDLLLKIPFTVWIDELNDVAKIDIQDNEILLNKGEFSGWVKLNFPVIPAIQNISGIVKFCLKECHPHLKLYVSPINVNPQNPALPITFPNSFSQELFKNVGYFYTQNMPPDTKALEHNVFSDDDFLVQMNMVFKEEEERLWYELKNFKEGFLFHYFCVNDQASHVFWRTIDPMHPLYTKKLNREYGDTLEKLYIKFDDIIGKLNSYIDDNTLLIIMSDHGFTSFRRGVNINTILLNNGFISLVDPESQGKYELFENVDWSNTYAYNLGINSVYINLFNRETDGIVFEEDYIDTCEKIRSLLLNYIDPETGLHPIRHVKLRDEIYSGPYVKDAPDLIIAYSNGYRASWDTILGKMPKEEISDNKSPWSGDHCISPDIVPGIIVTNKKILKTNPGLIDMAPTILDYFHIKKGAHMEGNSIFKNKE